MDYFITPKKKRFHRIKKKHDKIDFVMFLVVPSGLEPEQAVPETDVLPLHHGTISLCECKFSKIVIKNELFPLFFLQNSNEIVSSTEDLALDKYARLYQ